MILFLIKYAVVFFAIRHWIESSLEQFIYKENDKSWQCLETTSQ